MREHIGAARSQLAILAAGLDGVSPLQTLERGYAIIADTETGTVIRNSDSLHERQLITGRLARGSFEAVIKKIKP